VQEKIRLEKNVQKLPGLSVLAFCYVLNFFVKKQMRSIGKILESFILENKTQKSKPKKQNSGNFEPSAIEVLEFFLFNFFLNSNCSIRPSTIYCWQLYNQRKSRERLILSIN